MLCVGVCGYLGRYSSHIILTVVRERALYTCICSPVSQLLKASKGTWDGLTHCVEARVISKHKSATVRLSRRLGTFGLPIESTTYWKINPVLEIHKSGIECRLTPSLPARTSRQKLDATA